MYTGVSLMTNLASNIYYNLILISLIPTFLTLVYFVSIKISISNKKKTRLIMELLFISILGFCGSVFFFGIMHWAFSELFKVSDHVRDVIPYTRTYRRFFVPTIFLLSWGVFIISFSLFSKTKFKRILLLILCLLPIALALFTLIIEPQLNNWLIIRFAIISSLPCWIVNCPVILTGENLWQMATKLLLRMHLLP